MSVEKALFSAVFVAAVSYIVVGALFTTEERDAQAVPEADRTETVAAIRFGDVVFATELATTDEERRRGLAFRTSLPRESGMLFVFDRDDHHGIWMKDMHFPIDIVWLNKDGTIVSFEENVSPESFPDVYRPHTPARFVLELSAGEIVKNKLKIGDQGIFIFATS